MNRRAVTAVVAGLAAAAAFGMSAGAADAAPAAKPHTHAKVSKDARLLAIAKKNVLNEIARKDTALVRVVKDSRLSRLDATAARTIRANAAADRAGLSKLKSAATDATTLADVRTVAAQVKLVRPEVYNIVVNSVAEAAEIQAEVAANATTIADLTAQADAKEAAGFDVSAVRTALDAAAASNTEAADAAAGASDAALKLTATASRAALAAVRDGLAKADDALDVVSQQLDAANSALAVLV